MVRIGKIAATHGLQGAVIIKHIIEGSSWLKKGDVLFIELQKKSYIPYFVTDVKATTDDEYIANVEDVATVEEARKLVGKQVYVQQDVVAGAAKNSPLSWIGFNLVDVNKGSLGPIEDVMQAGPQWLAKLTIEGKEVLVPLVEQMLVDVNVRNKYIRIDLPEGLIDVYLQ